MDDAGGDTDLHKCSAVIAIGTTIQGQEMRDRGLIWSAKFERVSIKGVAGTEATSQIPSRYRSLRSDVAHPVRMVLVVVRGVLVVVRGHAKCP